MQYDDLSQDTLERLEQAERLKLDGSHAEALMILEDLLLEDPANVSALEEIADNELSLERFERAETAATQAVTLDQQSYTGQYILGFLASRSQEWSKAIGLLKRANELRPNNSEILRCLGWVLFNSGEQVRGIVTLERALNLDHDSTLTLCDLGVAYLRLQAAPKAKSLFRRALEVEPANPRALECLRAAEQMQKLPAAEIAQ